MLQATPNDFEALVGAAEARIAMNDAKAAFPHLQRAHSQSKDPVRVMELLARAFEAVGQTAKARQVWLECAKAAARAGVVATQKKALEAALRLQPDDEAICATSSRRSVGRASSAIFALSKQPWAAPATEAEAKALTKAEVETRYGFPERAIRTLESAAEERVDLCRARRERRGSASDRRRARGARRAGRRRSARTPPARDAADAAREDGVRHVPHSEPTDDPMSLEGDLEPLDEELASEEMSPIDQSALEPETLEELEPIPDHPLPEEIENELAPLDPEQDPEPSSALVEGPEAEADLFAADGRSSEAMALYRKALVSDPSNERVLMKIGELLSGDPRTPPGTRPALAPAPPPEPPKTVREDRAPRAAEAASEDHVPRAAEAAREDRGSRDALGIRDARAAKETPPAKQPEARRPAPSQPVEIPLDEEVATLRLDDMSEDELRVLQARAWMSVFQYKDAIDAVHGVTGLCGGRRAIGCEAVRVEVGGRVRVAPARPRGSVGGRPRVPGGALGTVGPLPCGREIEDGEAPVAGARGARSEVPRGGRRESAARSRDARAAEVAACAFAPPCPDAAACGR